MPKSELDPSLASARRFRTLLDAMSRPGSVFSLPETAEPSSPMPEGLAALCLTLADLDTPLWLDPSAAPECARWLRFNCGCPLVADPGQAALACVLDIASMPPLETFFAGEAEYPDRSATIFIAVAGFDAGKKARLTGPGIENERTLAVDGLPDGFWGQWTRNHGFYPLGVDVFLVGGQGVVGLPRSVRAEVL